MGTDPSVLAAVERMLTDDGWTILGRGTRWNVKDIDVVARRDAVVVFAVVLDANHQCLNELTMHPIRRAAIRWMSMNPRRTRSIQKFRFDAFIAQDGGIERASDVF